MKHAEAALAAEVAGWLERAATADAAEDAVLVGPELAALRAPAQGPDLLDGGDLDAVRRPSLGRTVEALDVCQPLGDRLLRVGPYRPLVLRARAVHLPVRPAPVHRVL